MKEELAEKKTLAYQLDVLQDKYDTLVAQLKLIEGSPEEGLAKIREGLIAAQRDNRALNKTNLGLRKQVSGVQRENNRLKTENEGFRIEVIPLRNSVNSLSAERGVFIRKLRRAGVKI